MRPPRIALVLIGDGRDDLRKATIASWHAQAREYDLGPLINVDDRMHLLGFCGAIRYAWDRLRELDPHSFDYVFHLEEDWLFDRAFSIAHMARVLQTEPQVCQVALRRGQAPAETEAIIDRFPANFRDRHTGILGLGRPVRTQAWLEHRLFWTTNPSLYHRSIFEDWDWPEQPRCEARFTDTMLSESRTFGYWGDRDDAPWITHTGRARTGHGY